ncbi:MAG: hypothetical protein KGL59_01640 [Acidobacteriota bacterium]|nr:hypothetical protein [Acidobacteriota bacterium]
MQRNLAVISLVSALFLFAGPAAWAQSSGNSVFDQQSSQCAISNSDGTLSGGSSNPGQLFSDTIQTPNTGQAALLITPSLVTGLYTSNKLSQNNSTSTQNIGAGVSVQVDGNAVLPETATSGAGSYVIYDQRFIQVSATFLSELSACTTTCITLTESTLSAHSFNFVYPDPGQGEHTITVNWNILNGGNGEAACVGPATITVQQVQNYKQDQ